MKVFISVIGLLVTVFLFFVFSSIAYGQDNATCPLEYNGDTGVTIYGVCNLVYPAQAPTPIPQPTQVGPYRNLVVCPIDYNGDTGITTYGYCDTSTGFEYQLTAPTPVPYPVFQYNPYDPYNSYNYLYCQYGNCWYIR